ncbi:hypothetical protein IGM_06710 [Bacillus cereus HuB4-4]|uniref:Insecticidal crystal toxin domain-containing protein n=1 Tax=Bacillus cereus HuB4-4 TaxID=1053211 RepID=A0A9W5QMX4_BACCE|nr:hypothetical protein [Bacillus cereus]EOP78066.1 hypothetical protein IGM_06710 [Bacillus cereus HuB4-4]
MNGNGRNDGWNHNQQMPNGQMNQNHGGSCGCGCQQKQYGYEQQKQQYEQNNSQYMSNNQGNENMNGSYLYQGNSYDQQQSNENIYMQNQNDMYGNTNNFDSSYLYPSIRYTGGYNVLDVLPLESKQFQVIMNMKQIGESNRDHKHVLNAQENNSTGLYSTGKCSTKLINPYALVNEKINNYPNTQPFIFYKTDSGRFIIANWGNGRVLEIIDDPIDGKIIISNEFDGTNTNQFFTKNPINILTPPISGVDYHLFELSIERNGEKWWINNCNNRPDLQQRITAIRTFSDMNIYTFISENRKNINFPNNMVVNPNPLGNPRELKSLHDIGDEPKVLKGIALLPCIIVNDPGLSSLDQKIKQSPYYILEYTQSWNRTWTDALPSGSAATWPITLGILPSEQEDMRNKIDMTIGGPEPGANLDFTGFRFGNRSTNFASQILSGLNLKSSNYSDMGKLVKIGSQVNTNNSTIRYVKYMRQHEFQLKRLNETSDPTPVGLPWIMVENKEITREYVENSSAIG